MTRRLLVILLALGLLSLVGCGSMGGTGSPRLERILQSRELRVGLSGSQPPLNMRNKQGDFMGLEVDLVGALAESMGLEVRVVAKPFAQLLPALEAGEVDLVISGMTITPERNARVAFVGPYLVSGKSVLTKDRKLAAIRKSEALDDPGRSYAALQASTSAKFVEKMAPRSKLVTTVDYESGIQMVIDGRVDALIADFPICEVSLLRHPNAGLATLTTPLTVEPLGIALPSGDPLFVNLVQNYLTTIEDTGKLVQLKARWFSYGNWVSELR